MNDFERTKLKAESGANEMLRNRLSQIAKEEIYSSAGHQEISMSKLVAALDLGSNTELSKNLREHIANVYYHIGKIQAASNYL